MRLSLLVTILLTLLCSAPLLADPPRVVVFCERGFPYFGANQAVSPRIVAETLRGIGIEAGLVDAQGLISNALDAPDVRALTQRYMRRLDLRTLQTYHGSWGEPPDFRRDGNLALFARRLPRLNGLFPDVGRHETTTYAQANYFLAGAERGSQVPVFHCLTRWIPWTYSPDVASRPEDAEVEGLVNEVRKMTPPGRPAFMSAFVLSWTFRPAMINRAAQKLGDPYVFVTPSQLAALFRRRPRD